MLFLAEMSTKMSTKGYVVRCGERRGDVVGPLGSGHLDIASTG